MAFDAFALQKAIFGRLAADILDIPSFSNVPQQQVYPYIRIDGITVTDDSTKDVGFIQCEVMLSVFYKDVASTEGVLGALMRMQAALHNREADLNALMSGQKAILFRREMQMLVPQQEPGDDQYQHGVQRYRTLIQEL